ncbi:hypothetical protein [Acidocella sp.]|uniref:hypothetical protein n=1 Tax=Acidocella sp. TaxID=50710 RepID=UPI00261509D9|nr:hypothetical protein [Acidocella sp.]MDD2794638.1 hypothetical protein [Acidocella sp.]
MPPVNVRASSFFVVAGACRCWHCGHETDVYVLGVDPPFTRRNTVDPWQDGTRPAILAYIERLTDSVLNRLPQLAPRYFCDSSKWHQRPYWLNHCRHCAAKIGDFEIIEAAWAPLHPSRNPSGASEFTRIDEPFEAAAVAHLCQDKGWDNMFARLGPQDTNKQRSEA